MTITKEGSGLLTDAEVALAQRRVTDNGLSEDDAVASVKSERVGPAAVTETTPAANVPGGNIAPPPVNGPEQRLAALYAQRDVLEAEILAVENDLEVRARAYPQGPAGTPITADEFAKPPGDGSAPVDADDVVLTPDSTDDEIGAAPESDVVAFVVAYPDQGIRVIGIEEARENRPAVIDAAKAAAGSVS